jgi:hypothetical protein
MSQVQLTTISGVNLQIHPPFFQNRMAERSAKQSHLATWLSLCERQFALNDHQQTLKSLKKVLNLLECDLSRFDCPFCLYFRLAYWHNR